MRFLILVLLLISGKSFAEQSIYFHIECESNCLELKNVNDGVVAKLVKEPAMSLGASDILDARVSKDQEILNEYLGLTLSEKKAIEFEKITGDNIGKRLAIVVDNKVLTFPTIQAKISGGRIQISFGVGNSAENFLKQNVWLAEIVESKVVTNDKKNQTNLLAYILFGAVILGGTLFYAFREKKKVT